jgi:hypothetical protein
VQREGSNFLRRVNGDRPRRDKPEVQLHFYIPPNIPKNSGISVTTGWKPFLIHCVARSSAERGPEGALMRESRPCFP